MGSAPGTMGLGLVEFVVMWALMMTAMMLPSMAPVASLYARMLRRGSPARLGLFALGYGLAWAVTGLVAYGLAWSAGRLAVDHPTGARIAAVAVFALVGVYQLTPLKFRCLRHCRTPLGHLMHYASFRGPLRDTKAGLHHALFCLGCCWALILLMISFGVMNIWAMVGLALVIALEKLSRYGERLARVVGAVSLSLAVLVIFVPEVAPGLKADDTMQMPASEME
jgi:predicted metal-binding membrane protein